jgi:hypothetical protein
MLRPPLAAPEPELADPELPVLALVLELELELEHPAVASAPTATTAAPSQEAERMLKKLIMQLLSQLSNTPFSAHEPTDERSTAGKGPDSALLANDPPGS